MGYRHFPPHPLDLGTLKYSTTTIIQPLTPECHFWTKTITSPNHIIDQIGQIVSIWHYTKEYQTMPEHITLVGGGLEHSVVVLAGQAVCTYSPSPQAE